MSIQKHYKRPILKSLMLFYVSLNLIELNLADLFDTYIA